MSLYQDLCTPAKVYITLAVIYMIGAYFSMNEFSNFMQVNQSKLHPYLNSLNFSVSKSTNGVTLVNILFTLLWTWLLNRLCSAGYIRVSWFLVLFPYLLLFLAIAVCIWALLKMHIVSQKWRNEWIHWAQAQGCHRLNRWLNTHVIRTHLFKSTNWLLFLSLSTNSSSSSLSSNASRFRFSLMFLNIEFIITLVL